MCIHCGHVMVHIKSNPFTSLNPYPPLTNLASTLSPLIMMCSRVPWLWKAGWRGWTSKFQYPCLVISLFCMPGGISATTTDLGSLTSFHTKSTKKTLRPPWKLVHMLGTSRNTCTPDQNLISFHLWDSYDRLIFEAMIQLHLFILTAITLCVEVFNVDCYNLIH